MTETTPSSKTRPPKQSRTGLKANGTRKAASKSNRSRAREFALQALYQHIVGRNDAAAIDSFTRDLAGFHKADAAHYNAVLHGCINTADDLDALITPLLDRKLGEISPIERASMWIGVYEFMHCMDVPWRVVLNECIELAKEFGGTDGHKYVNAVLNGLAPRLRANEVAADKAAGKPGPEAAAASMRVASCAMAWAAAVPGRASNSSWRRCRASRTEGSLGMSPASESFTASPWGVDTKRSTTCCSCWATTLPSPSLATWLTARWSRRRRCCVASTLMVA